MSDNDTRVAISRVKALTIADHISSWPKAADLRGAPK
jgi:hypothetical protein